MAVHCEGDRTYCEPWNPSSSSLRLEFVSSTRSFSPLRLEFVSSSKSSSLLRLDFVSSTPSSSPLRLDFDSSLANTSSTAFPSSLPWSSSSNSTLTSEVQKTVLWSPTDSLKYLFICILRFFVRIKQYIIKLFFFNSFCKCFEVVVDSGGIL